MLYITKTMPNHVQIESILIHLKEYIYTKRDKSKGMNRCYGYVIRNHRIKYSEV